MNFSMLDKGRLNAAKHSYSARRISQENMAQLTSLNNTPKSGDLVLARVEVIGQHKRIQLGSGRLSRLFVGDEVLVCYGNRYAPDQFEAYVPDDLGLCHLVASGGIASSMQSKSGKVADATQITPLGLVTDVHGQVLNLADFALPAQSQVTPDVPVIAVAGTAMNAGKTETVINLVKGLTRAGLRVGAAKVTGTGAGGDVWKAVDAGAHKVLDFTDAGMPTTFLADIEAIENGANTLVGHLLEEGVDAIVIEIADGLLQKETSQLLASPRFTNLLDGLIFAAGDAMGAISGSTLLQSQSQPLLGLSGALSLSPLAMRETTAMSDLPVWDMATLSDPEFALDLIAPFKREVELRRAI